MEVTVKTYQNVDIDPQEIIKDLLENEYKPIKQKDKYYIECEVGGGSHSWFEKKEVTKEYADYIDALNVVRKYLKKHS